MRKQILSVKLLVLITTVSSISCQKNIEQTEQEEISSQSNSSNANANEQSKKTYVNNISELYAAINDPENSGGTIVLAPGTYMLSANYPKAGRLELLHNMSLIGKPGHSEEVIIDATQLPLSSFTIAPSNARTGAVRMGDGNNSIEWITFQNDPAHTIRSLIQTDIVTTPTTKIKVAHCIIKGSSIGLSILNRDPVANGRVLEADIADNEIMDNTIQQFGSGIQIQNTLVNDAVLKVRLSRNNVFGNRAGMMIFNSSSQRCSLEVKSYDESIVDNGVGLVLVGSLILNAASPSMDNTFIYKSHGMSLKSNNGIPAPPFSFPSGGVFAPSGLAMTQFGPPGTAHNNKLEISFHGSAIEDNIGGAQISAYGAYSYYSLPPLNNNTLVGTGNKTTVYLYGQNSNTTVNAINSIPTEAAGTNSVNVYR